MVSGWVPPKGAVHFTKVQEALKGSIQTKGVPMSEDVGQVSSDAPMDVKLWNLVRAGNQWCVASMMLYTAA